MLNQRGQLLRAALGFAGLPRPSYDRSLWALRTWLDSWSGIGHVAVGMHRQGFDLQLTQYDERGWRATFYTTGMEHSPTSATGTGWERTPWRATQRAAWEALRRTGPNECDLVSGGTMQTNWFYTVWPFIGLGGAIVMVAILLMTDTFRGDTSVSRWRDPMWLAWLAVPLYWIHQFEEYSLPVIGLDYSIQEMICKNIGFPPYPDCPIPLAFYPVVNIALMWFGAPLAAYLFRRNVLIGLSFWGLLFANGLVHTAGGVAAGAYNTGLWSAAILFVPLSVWVIYASVIRGPYSGKVVGVAFAAGALTHVLLFLGYGLFKSEVIGSAGLLVYAAVIGFTPIILAALGSRFFKPELLRPLPVQ